MTDSATTSRFPPLDSSNYPTWRVDCKALLQSKGVWRVVAGSWERPTGTTKADKDEAREWDEKDEQAKRLIGANVKVNKEEVVEAATAATAWTFLTTLNERKGLAMAMRLTAEFYRLSKLPGDSMTAHISEIKQKVRRLEGLDRKISEADKVMVLLYSVQEEYSNVITTLQASWDKTLQKDEVVSFSSVCEALLNEEVRIEGKERDEREVRLPKRDLGALQVKAQERRKRTCYVCDSEDHLKMDCPVLKAGRNALATGKSVKEENFKF